MKGLIARLALMFFLLSQFAIAVHAYEHDATNETFHDCKTCLQLQAGHDGLACGELSLEAVPLIQQSAITLVAAYHATPTHPPRNKSPPLS